MTLYMKLQHAMDLLFMHTLYTEISVKKLKRI